ANLSHPHILPLFDSGEAYGFLFYVMPHVEGESLKEKLDREGQLSVEEAVSIGAKVASALHAAHEQGVIHRDIKPANILVANGEPLVADFGISLNVEERAQTRLTEKGMSIGTPTYMSPEQGLQDGKLDARSDVYSLGCVLYEMLVGDPPFSAKNPMAVLARKTTEEPPPIAAVRPAVPSPVETVVLKALGRVPADRFTSAGKLASALTSSLAAPAGVSGEGRGADAGRWPASARWAPGIMVAVVLTGAAWAFGPWSDAAEQTVERIAVMPIANVSGDPSNDYWSTGLAGEIWSKLSLVTSLKLASQQAAVFTDPGGRPSEMAIALGVDAVIVGTVLPAGDSIRVSLELVDREDEVLWSQSYTRRVSDVLRLTSQIATEVADEIHVSLSDDEQLRLAESRAVDPVAQRLALQGTDILLTAFNEETTRRAIGLLDEAIAADSSHAGAWSGLSVGYTLLTYLSRLPPDSTIARARDAAARAINLDSTLADAHGAYAFAVAVTEWDWATAVTEFEVAASLSPSVSGTQTLHAFLLAWLGRHDEAERIIRQVQADHPAELIPIAQAAEILYLAGRYEEAIEKGQEALAFNPDNMWSHARVVHPYVAVGQLDSALVHAERVVELSPDPLAQSGVAYIHALQGRAADARETLNAHLADVAEGIYVPPLAIALIYVGLGDTVNALDWVRRGYEVRDGDLGLLGSFHVWDPIRHEPEFQEILELIGLPETVRGDHVH
ncbi:MAG: protein kinase, partial [Acidimicrobiia bacterium]|nr:protein kinase [Acidimicrobiia bacterium]